ncbi:hypothetical protein NA56DRAFT_701135 [Hyaloscypha hepaticicola]|uniref:Uncharacterized protein n=1 Tax=Hyaloscypha hepaticicola TaxID=2082293 RepID=A0A2J6QBV5_9HELO|nr:hypothetical protein NA56DRAFT_701135 [Hyaloscypha hepaticicola]
MSTLVVFLGMTKARAKEVWKPYLACRRRQIIAALGLKTNVPNGVAWELIVAEKDLANREGRWGEVTAGVKSSGKVMGLREWVLGVFLPPILEKYGWFGNSKGFDQLTKEEVRKCMAEIGMDADYQDYWTQNLWERLCQVGSFDRWIKFYWCELWDSCLSIDGKVRRGETIDL